MKWYHSMLIANSFCIISNVVQNPISIWLSTANSVIYYIISIYLYKKSK